MSDKRKFTTAKILYWMGIFLVLLMAGTVGLFWKQLPPQLPWYYSLPWGESQLINKLVFMWIFLGTGVSLTFIRLVANWAGKDDATVQNTIMTGAFVAIVLILASFSRVMMIFLNT